MNLPMAKYIADRFYRNTLVNIDEKHLIYPD